MQERWWNMLAVVFGAAVAGAGAVIAFDSTRFVRREYKVYSDKIEKGCKIVLLSDLHNKRYGQDNRKLLEEIDRINPDVVLTAGDMMTANEGKTCCFVPIRLFGHLAEKYPVYYGMGNHEYRMKVYRKAYGDMFDVYKKELKECGVRFLENERVYLPEYNIDICGLEIERYLYKRWYRKPMEEGYIERLLGKAKEERFELLIGHNPEYFKEYVKWGADLTVSGHVHGGVVRVPFFGGLISPSLRIFPEYDGGLFEEQGKKMVLSRGLGMHTIPLRMLNPGELVVIHLER